MNKKYIDELLEEVPKIEKMVHDFFNLVQVKYSPSSGGRIIVLGFSDYSWDEPTGNVLDIQRELINSYEDWFSQTNNVISKIIPDRRPDFVKLYEENKEIIELKTRIWSNSKEKFKNNFLRNIGKQKSILSSTLGMLKSNNTIEKKEANDNSLKVNTNSSIDAALYIDLKAQMTILTQQYSRIEADIKDLAQKVEGIGRITINNMNNNIAKTGAIKISNENLIKWAKPDLDKELKRLKGQIQDKDIDNGNKQIIKDLIDLVLETKNPKIDWLKEKISQIQYWGSKAGIVMTRFQEIADAFGADNLIN